jgi:hypothetical protein
MDDEIIKMYEGGLSVNDIAFEMGRPVQEIKKILQAVGVIQKQGRKSSTETLSEKQRKEIVKHYVDNTLTGIQIIAKYAITWNGLYKLLDEEGIPFREFKRNDRIAREMRMERAIEMYQGGARLWEITNETGIRQPQLHAELHKRDIPLRRG